MTEDTRHVAGPDARDNEPRLSAAALRDWSAIVESVMRGVAHDLNNRAVALSAIIELSRDPVAEDAAAVQSILSQELARVTELGRVMRTIGQPRATVEAFAPADVAQETAVIVALHPAHRERSAVIDASRASPVRLVRWMFVRALIALATNGESPKNAVPRLVIADEDDWVVARRQDVTMPAVQLSPYATELARAMGGDPLVDAAGFRVPSLAALRRREGR